MKIKEYIIVNDNEKHPKLKEKNVIEWDDKFLNYDKIVKFLNSNFNMNILSEEYVYTFETYDTAHEYYKTFSDSYITENGERVVAFGYYGHD